MEQLKVVFFGTPDFALPIVNMLSETERLVAVVTQPDKPKGRGLKVEPPPVKRWATEHGVEFKQPNKIKDAEFINWLRSKDADVFCTAAYGKILPKEVLELPKLGCINVHASLLPRWRGAAPINWAIIEGDEKTGISIMQMDEGMDTGPIFYQVETEIEPHERAGELSQRLSIIGAEALKKVLEMLKRGEATLTPQPKEGVTYAPMIKKDMAKIDWTKPAKKIVNLIRGLHPTFCAYTFLFGKRLLIHRARVSNLLNEPASPATIVSAKDSIIVASGEGTVELLEVQLEGKRPMDVKSFLLGHPLKIGMRLGE